MRLALISDIHGNAVALEAALVQIAAQSVDQIVCLGDVAATGPQPREVLARLQALACPVVMGNTDAALLQPRPPGDAPGERRSLFAVADSWSATQLTADDRAYVATFQSTVRVSLGSAGTLLGYHGWPRSFLDRVLPTTPDDELDAMFADFQATILAGGHTHQQMLRRYRGAILLNPGSVGLSFYQVAPPGEIHLAPWAEYAVVVAEPGHLYVELHRAAFDVDVWAEAVRASGMPDAELWIDARAREWV
jgi:predicted phosphodiesterase